MITTQAEAMRQIFNVRAPLPNFRPRYNMTPTQEAPVVRIRDGRRELANLRWGLIPHWAKDAKIGYSTINARVETVESKPAFRDAWRKRRCLVPADAFFEWQPQGKGPKQPYRIGMKDGALFGMAGLWESWQHEGETIDSFTIIVGPPNSLVKPIHDRMPAIVRTADYDAWLTGAGGKELLGPYPAEAMVAEPISTRINNGKNDDASCVEPLPAP
jgi:putative SOS response-associated peptidase YedK